MTHRNTNSKERRLAREYMKTHDVKYTEALRAIRADFEAKKKEKS